MLKGLIGTVKCSFPLFISYFSYTGLIKAEIIQKTLKNGLVASAEFNQGENNAAAILIQHKCLQTSKSSTVSRLYKTPVNSDYAIMPPDFSPGISNRKQYLKTLTHKAAGHVFNEAYEFNLQNVFEYSL